MSKLPGSGATPENVAATATRANAFDLTSIGVLGIFGPESDLRALMRFPGGKIQKVGPGQRLNFGRVVGIDSSGIMLQSSGQVRRIEMPRD